MFEGIKHKIGLRKMRKEFINLRRNGKVINLEQAQSVAIIYRVEDEKKLTVVKNYVKHLKEEEGVRKIMTLGYFPEKEMSPFLKPQLEFDFFCKKDMQWNERPGGTTVKNFCSEYYDILIDIEREEIVPLRYILNWSKAKFKVGYYTEEHKNYYDLMMQVPKEDTAEFIAQVNYYLSIINKVS